MITYSKCINSDGGFVVLETIAIPREKEDALKFPHGTCKWKVIARGKAMTPSTFRNCYKATGTFELSK